MLGHVAPSGATRKFSTMRYCKIALLFALVALTGCTYNAPKMATTRADGLAAWQQVYSVLTHPRCINVSVDVHIVPGTEKPSGCGEPPVPVIAPAVVNALAKLTGKRYRSLPLVSL